MVALTTRSALCALVLLVSSTARSAEPTPSYALSWVRAEGAEECPNGRALTSEVERRLGRRVFDASAERAFEVEVTRFGNTYRSDVFVRDASGRTIGHRTLQSDEPGCSALVSATALAVALVIDPEALARETPPAQSEVAFEAPPTQAPVLPPTPAPEPAPAAKLSPAPPALSPPSSAPRPSVDVALRGEVTSGLVPAASPGFELAIDAYPWQSWGFALSAAYTASQHVSRGIGSLDLSLTRAAALLTFSPARSDRLRLVLGLGPSLGALHVAVHEPAPVTDPGDFWFAAAEGRLLLNVLLSERVFVDVGGSAFVPLARQQFIVRGQTDPVWQEPLLSGRGFFGVGVRLP